MSVVDAVPPGLSPQLRDLLVRAYDEVEPLRDLGFQVGLADGTFPRAGDLRGTCTKLIRVLEKQGRLRPFVELAAEDPTVAAFHGRFRELLASWPTRPPDGDRPVPHTAAAERAGYRKESLQAQRSRLMDIGLVDEVARAAASVARLTLRFAGTTGYGTGFLITDDLLVTAGHNVLDRDLGAVREIIAEFDHVRTPRVTALECRVPPEPVAGDSRVDWAVLRLAEPVDRAPLPFGSLFTPYPDDFLLIIQHPSGSFKQFALEPLAVTHVDELYLRYVADTLSGSSGAPVFNDRMEVVGVHRGEAAESPGTSGSPNSIQPNEGVRAEPVLRELERIGIVLPPRRGGRP